MYGAPGADLVLEELLETLRILLERLPALSPRSFVTSFDLLLKIFDIADASNPTRQPKALSTETVSGIVKGIHRLVLLARQTPLKLIFEDAFVAPLGFAYHLCITQCRCSSF